MVHVKKLFMKTALLLEMVAFGYVYMCGKNGICVYRAQKNVVEDLKKDILVLDNEVAQLQKEMHVWQTDDFYKEKVAREQLQMARKGDELFYIG